MRDELKMFDMIMEQASAGARIAAGGEKHLKEKEKNEKESNWGEIKEKHGITPREIDKLSNYVFESLISYLNIQDSTEELFNGMSAEKKKNGESEKYQRLKQEWQKKKELLQTFHLSDEKKPSEITSGNEGSLAPSDFIRKHNLGALNRRQRNFLLDILDETYNKRKERQRDNKEENKAA